MFKKVNVVIKEVMVRYRFELISKVMVDDVATRLTRLRTWGTFLLACLDCEGSESLITKTRVDKS